MGTKGGHRAADADDDLQFHDEGKLCLLSPHAHGLHGACISGRGAACGRDSVMRWPDIATVVERPPATVSTTVLAFYPFLLPASGSDADVSQQLSTMGQPAVLGR